MAAIIDGKAISEQIRQELAAEVAAMKQKVVTPGLAVVLVGEDPASQVYVRNKLRACQQIGIYWEDHRLPAETTEETLLDLIRELNRREEIHGILVQLPLPEGLDPRPVLHALSPEKDVDCFHPLNTGLLALGEPRFLPCTPAGVLELLDAYGVPIPGRLCVILGRSHLVGRPLAQLLTARDGTVILCHSKTRNLPALTRQADVLIAAAGHPGLVTADMVKPGAAVVDVAMNRRADGKLTGDVDFPAVEPVAGFLTPVPGGVGPMTRACLLQNVLRAARLRQGAER